MRDPLVLIVDDDFLQVEELTADLEEWLRGRVKVCHVSSLVGLRTLLASGRLAGLSLAIVDIMLAYRQMGEEPDGRPVSDERRAGVEAIESIRSTPGMETVPVVAFSILGWKDLPVLRQVPGPPVSRVHKRLDDDQLRVTVLAELVAGR